MREFITGKVVANWVRMVRQTHSGAIVLAEGDADSRLYSQIIDQSSCVIINAHEKQNVIDALEILGAQKFEGILGIVDADCNRLTQEPLPSNNLLLTDTHDLDTMLIASPSLEKVLLEHGSQTKLSRLEKPVRQIIIDTALPYAYLRLVSVKQALSLDFEGLKYGRFINKKTSETDALKLIIAILSRSKKGGINPNRLLKSVIQMQKEKHDPWQICCGDDMIHILSIELCSKFGTNNPQQVHPKIIEKALHIGYEPAYFSSTILYQSIKAWEEVNNNFRVLPT